MPSPSRTVRTEAFYRWRSDTPLTADELNRRFVDMHLRLQFAETEKLSDAALRQEVGDKVLAQSEAVIAGLRDKLLALTQLEWLTASSSTPNTLVEGETRTFLIPVEQRELFTPGPYVVLGREGQPDTYAVARGQTFDRETGLFDVTLTVIVTPDGEDGPWSDWEIGSLAGSTLAQMTMLQQGFDAREQAVAAQQDIAPRHADIIAKHAQIDTDAATATAAATLATEKAALAVAAASAVDPAALNARFAAIEAVTARPARIRHSWFHES